MFKHNLTGIDIGSYSIKVVSFKGGPGSYTLEAAACFKLPAEWSHNDKASGACLSEVLRSSGVRSMKAAALMSGKSMTFRHFYLPSMPEKDLKEAVRWEIRKETDIASDDLVCDFIVAGGGAKAGENNLSIIAFAVKKSDVGHVLDLLKSAGVTPVVIDAVPTALLAAFDMFNPWEAGANYAMLDIGDSGSTLSIFKNRKLAFAREIAYCGHDLTHALAFGLNKDEAEAEEYKIAYGLNAPDDGMLARDIISSSLEVLCRELQRSFDYYQAQFREGGVSRLFLSGGSSRLKGVEGFITEALGIPAFKYDPFGGVKIPGSVDKENLRSIAPCLTIAAGLATRIS